MLTLFRTLWWIGGTRSLCQRSSNTVVKRLLQESKFTRLFLIQSQSNSHFLGGAQTVERP